MSRPPLPPFTAETAAQKVRLAEDAWNSRDPRARVARLHRGQPLAKPRRVPPGPARRSSSSSRASGPGARLPADQGALGLHRQPHRRALRLRVARRQRPTGSAPTATRTGSSTSTASCAGASPASTTCRSPEANASITGRSAAGPTIIRGSATWACDPPHARDHERSFGDRTRRRRRGRRSPRRGHGGRPRPGTVRAA